MSRDAPDLGARWVVDDARPTFWWIVLGVVPLVALMIAAPFLFRPESLALGVVAGAGGALAVTLLFAFFRGPRVSYR